MIRSIGTGQRVCLTAQESKLGREALFRKTRFRKEERGQRNREFRRPQASQRKAGNLDCGWGRANRNEMAMAEGKSIDLVQSAVGDMVSIRF